MSAVKAVEHMSGFAKKRALEAAGFEVTKIRDGDIMVWAVHDPKMDMPGSIVTQDSLQGNAVTRAITILGGL
jgi:hypothetical protein